MLTSKAFWIGFMVAYVLAVFLPPTKLMGKKKKPGM